MTMPSASEKCLSPREKTALDVRKARDLFLMERPSTVGPILLAHLFLESLMRHALWRKVKGKQLDGMSFSKKLDQIAKRFDVQLAVYPWSALHTLNKCRNEIAHNFGREIPREICFLVESIGNRSIENRAGASDIEKRIGEFILNNKDTPFAEMPVALVDGKEELATAFHHAIVQLYIDVAEALDESLLAISGMRPDPHAPED